MLPTNVIDGPQFDYVNKGNPTIDVNPRRLYATWLNITSGELWVCIDATTNLNVWRGNNGHSINYYTPVTATVFDSYTLLNAEYGGLCQYGKDSILACNYDYIRLYDINTYELQDAWNIGDIPSYPTITEGVNGHIIVTGVNSTEFFIYAGWKGNLLGTISVSSNMGLASYQGDIYSVRYVDSNNVIINRHNGEGEIAEQVYSGALQPGDIDFDLEGNVIMVSRYNTSSIYIIEPDFSGLQRTIANPLAVGLYGAKFINGRLNIRRTGSTRVLANEGDVF